jgi:hypothetical protein
MAVLCNKFKSNDRVECLFFQSGAKYEVVKVCGSVGLEYGCYKAIAGKIRLLVSSLVEGMPEAHRDAIKAFAPSDNYVTKMRRVLEQEKAASKKHGVSSHLRGLEKAPKKIAAKDAFLGLWKVEEVMKEAACLMLDGMIPQRLRPMLRHGGAVEQNVLVENYLEAIKRECCWNCLVRF